MPAQIPHQTTIGRFKRIALTIPAIRWLNRQRHQLRTLGAQSVNRDVHTAETRVQTGMPGPEVNRPSQPKIDIPSNENAYLMIGTTAKDFLYAIDQFSVFQGTVRVSGWAYDPTSRIKRLALRFPSGRNYELTNFKLPSPDVAEVHGQNMKDCRFDDVFYMPQDAADAMKAELVIEFDEKPSKVISNLGGTATDPARMLYARFLSLLKGKSIEQPSGHLLEIGSRARSGITRRDIIPERWQYTGLDVLPGPNVDIVGDAHRLSHIFPTERFSAVMAFSVLEHLLMPWKFVIELNKVLLPGAIGIFTTHQSWPVHDAPWDFWRFSDQAWRALLNPATGFEIIDAQMGEPAFTVAQKLHPITNFIESPSYLASCVLFRKTAETNLDWPVEVAETISTEYPKGETKVTL